MIQMIPKRCWQRFECLGYSEVFRIILRAKLLQCQGVRSSGPWLYWLELDAWMVVHQGWEGLANLKSVDQHQNCGTFGSWAMGARLATSLKNEKLRISWSAIREGPILGMEDVGEGLRNQSLWAFGKRDRRWLQLPGVKIQIEVTQFHLLHVQNDLKLNHYPPKSFSSCVFVAPGTPRIRTAQIPVESITRPASLKLVIDLCRLVWDPSLRITWQNSTLTLRNTWKASIRHRHEWKGGRWLDYWNFNYFL